MNSQQLDSRDGGSDPQPLRVRPTGQRTLAPAALHSRRRNYQAGAHLYGGFMLCQFDLGACCMVVCHAATARVLFLSQLQFRVWRTARVARSL